MLDLLAKHKVPLIEDDIYGDIYFGAERPKPFMALDRRGTTIYCSSFSKTIAPGYRIGWIASARHMKRILDSKIALTLCGPALPQAALAALLSSGGYDSHLRRIRRVFEDNLGQMIRTVDRAFRAAPARRSPPAGSFYGSSCPRGSPAVRSSSRRWMRASASPRATSSRRAAATAIASGSAPAMAGTSGSEMRW